MITEQVKIVVFVPTQNADQVRQAMGEAGAGKIGNYNFCSFSSKGFGRFVPNDQASPHIGEKNTPEIVEEERIEMICDRQGVKRVISEMKKFHPYEEVAFDIYPMLNEAEL